jgi:hypothetical protein
MICSSTVARRAIGEGRHTELRLPMNDGSKSDSLVLLLAVHQYEVKKCKMALQEKGPGSNCANGEETDVKSNLDQRTSERREHESVHHRKRCSAMVARCASDVIVRTDKAQTWQAYPSMFHPVEISKMS